MSNLAKVMYIFCQNMQTLEYKNSLRPVMPSTVLDLVENIMNSMYTSIMHTFVTLHVTRHAHDLNTLCPLDTYMYVTIT